MEEDGVTRGIFELFEIILPIALLLLIGGAILIVSNPDFSRSYVFGREISYVSSLTSNNMLVEINVKNTKLDKIKLNVEDEKVFVSVGGKGEIVSTGSTNFGKDVKLEQKSESVILISK